MVFYVLDADKNAVRVSRPPANFFEDVEARQVGLDEDVNGYDISTVFLGLDHGIPTEPPKLFETMVFFTGTLDDVLCYRCATWDEAQLQHRQVVEAVKSGTSPSIDDTVGSIPDDDPVNSTPEERRALRIFGK